MDNCIYNRKFDCIIVGMNLPLTGWCRNDLSELDFQAYRVTPSIAESMFPMSRKRRSWTCWTTGRRYVGRSSVFLRRGG